MLVAVLSSVGDMLEANGYTANVSVSLSSREDGKRTRPVHRMEDENYSRCEIMDVLSWEISTVSIGASCRQP